MKPEKTLSLIFKSIIILLFIIYLGVYLSHSDDTRHQEALQEYKKGEVAQSVAERENAFNKALLLYKQLENDNSLDESSGKLFYNIGNTYYELGQYASAVLYYNKALKLDPSNDLAERNLQVTLAKLKLPAAPAISWWERILRPNLGMSIPQRHEVFFAATLAFFLLGSFYIWKKIPLLKRFFWIAFGLALLMLVSLFTTRYFETDSVIVLKPVFLYRDAGKQYAKVQQDPLPEGSKLEVLEAIGEGSWLKVSTDEGTLGFVPVDSVGLI